MPRQQRESPPPQRRVRSGRTFLGRPWPLPVSPVVTGLLILFVLAAGLTWYFEGRFETTPAEAAKQLTPYKADDVQQVVLTTNSGSATFTRDETSGKLVPPGPQPTPSPTPGPEATPGPVQLAPGTQMESLLNQLHDLKIDRTIEQAPSTSAEYGLDAPQLTLKMVPKKGEPSTIAVGKLNPNQTAYYVRRDARKDTVLVPRYTLDDLMKVANDLTKPAGG